MAEDWREREQRRQIALEAERAAFLKRREELRAKLFGSPDAYGRQAPAPIEDFDALLAEHAAQLRNVVRHAMAFAVWEDAGGTEIALSASALTRLIQTNIAIAKVLGVRATSKTVRGGAPEKDTQD
jgi:predicted RNA-binding Zn ribbon-like protein